MNENFAQDYKNAVLEYQTELELHAEAQLRYAKALQKYNEAFEEYVKQRILRNSF